MKKDSRPDIGKGCDTDVGPNVNTNVGANVCNDCGTNIGTNVGTLDTRKTVDSNNDGEITEDEFVKNAMKSGVLKNMLEN